jgi:hypothetical protein
LLAAGGLEGIELLLHFPSLYYGLLSSGVKGVPTIVHPPPEIKRVFEEFEQFPRSLWGEAGSTARGAT